MTKRIGLLTAGSDCTGLNAAIRAIGKAGMGAYGLEIIGFQDGFHGLIYDQTTPIHSSDLSGILTTGGTILGTSRDLPHSAYQGEHTVDMTDQAVATYHRQNLDALICIGGRETQESALHLARQGLKVITLPKAIDNDVAQTEQTVGFNTALEVAAQSIDRLHSTAHSHHRIILVEMMGAHTGWLALGAGIAGGADVILIPEIPYNIHQVAEAILTRKKAGKQFSIVAVSERVISQDEMAFSERLRRLNNRLRPEAERQEIETQLTRIEEQRTDTTFQVANQLKSMTGLETRSTILGYLLRGGAPSASDRNLATQFGTACMALAADGCFGVMVAVRQGRIEPVPLEQVAGQHKPIPTDHPWLESARHIGVHLGI